MALHGTVDELARRVLGSIYRIHLEAEGPESDIAAALRSIPGAADVWHLNGRGYQVEAERDLRAEAAKAVIAADATLLQLDIETRSLDTIYTRYFEEVEHAAAD